MARNQHEDFGEKIGGAKKDLWSDRGLLVEDLHTMNDREAEKYVKKDNIWKKPDYQALIDEGVPLSVAYFIKIVRDSINASPRYGYLDNTPERRLARQEEYIATVRDLREVMETTRTVEDALRASDRFFVEKGYATVVGGTYGRRYRATEKGSGNPIITNALATVMYVRSAEWFEQYMTKQAAQKQFCVPKDQKVPAGYEILLHDGKYSYSRNNDWTPGTYFVAKKHRILAKNFETREAALSWVKEFAKGQTKSGKSRFVPPQLKQVQRAGPDFRGQRSITGQDYIDTFGFRGGEYGNWMNQNDRQASLDMGFEALKDLAAALQITDKDIAFQGELAIAFGARGSGNAVAHYEPLRKVINLTKMRGAGSLAHEWWHGLDDYLGGKMKVNGMLSEHPFCYPLFKKLIETIKYKPETPEQAAARATRMEKVIRQSAESWLEDAMGTAFKQDGREATQEAYETLKASFLAGEAGAVDKLHDLKKSITGRGIPKEARLRLRAFESRLQQQAEPQPPVPNLIETDFYRDSKAMGQEYERDGGYWDSEVELTARAFACYVMDKLPYQSDYLVGHAESAVALKSGKDGELSVIRAYPQGDERRAINAVFDEIVADLKLHHLLTHEDKAIPAQESKSHEMGSDQLSMFDNERPSVLGKLAAAKAATEIPSKQTPTKKPQEAAL